MFIQFKDRNFPELYSMSSDKTVVKIIDKQKL
jgi:hypothetical protein